MTKIVSNIFSPHCEIQKTIMHHLANRGSGTRFLWVSCGTKFGKCLTLQEKIPTPSGWRTMEDIAEGDHVFNENGQPTKVVYKTDKMYGHICYRIHFSDGNTVDCDEEHLWLTTTHCERKNIARAKSSNDRCKSTNAKPTVRTTKEILETIEIEIGGKKRSNHSIPLVSSPLEYNSKTKLIVDPYVLGCWLSDGGRNSGSYCKTDEFILNEIRKHYPIIKKVTYTDNYVKGLITDLKKIEVNEEKHVPNEYLVASIEDRLSLLQGLMDGDGTISKKGDCTFDNTNEKLANAVEELCISLGIKCTRTGRYGKLNGIIKKWCYRVHFTTDMKVFRTPKKAERLRAVSPKAKTRYIIKVEPIPSEPVQCIQVDSPSHLFLVGKGCIPTHNTLGAAGGYAYALPRFPGTTWRWVAPIYKQTKIAWKYLDQIFPTGLDIRKRNIIHKNKTDLIMTIPSIKVEAQFWHGQSPEDLEGEAIFGQVNDECAKLKKQVFDSSMTTWTFTQAQVLNISTPRGRNWFYNGCMRAKEEMAAAAREKRIPREIFLTAPTAANPFVPRASIIEAKRLLPDRLYRQYYEAEFIDDGATFPKPIIDYDQWAKPYEKDGAIEYWVHPDSKEMTIVAGCDWAKKKDYTVLICIDFSSIPYKCVGFLRFHHKRYTDQVVDIYRFLRRFKNCEMLYHDKTGVGEAIDDILSKIPDLVYHGIIFSNASKASMVNDLITGMEQEKIIFPWWPTLLHEFDVYEVITDDLGRAKYGAPDGDHDDGVSSSFLAYAAAEQFASRDFEVRILEDLPTAEETKDTWENYMSEQFDIDEDEGF